MPDMSYLRPLLGGALIGLSASLLLLTHGKIAGISGIYGGLLDRTTQDRRFRVWFIAGLIGAGAIALALSPSALPSKSAISSLPLVAVAGLFVGFGTRLGNGCTSGHGVCGISRLSKRSIIATITFISMGVVTVFFSQHVLGGAR